VLLAFDDDDFVNEYLIIPQYKFAVA